MQTPRTAAGQASAAMSAEATEPYESCRNWLTHPENALMGVVFATFGVLADGVSTAQDFVAVFFYVYILVIFVYILTSWIRLPYSLNWLQRFLYDVCEPYLRLFRRILPALGPLDVSPIIGVLVLVGVQQLAVRLIGTLD